MARKTIVLTPTTKEIIEKVGNRIKKARLRRNIRAELLAECAGISIGTFYAIEKGVSTVSVGAYAAVLSALDMESDLDMIALDEEGKQRYSESNLYRRERATKKVYEKRGTR